MSPRRNLVLVSGLLGLSAATLIAAENSASGNENLPAGAMRQKATTACLECHDARIILQQRLTKATWTKEVDKMVKWGAMVDSNDRDALIDYLSVNFSPDQSAYNAPRTAQENTQGKKIADKSAR
jgi:hypothetical protein